VSNPSPTFLSSHSLPLTPQRLRSRRQSATGEQKEKGDGAAAGPFPDTRTHEWVHVPLLSDSSVGLYPSTPLRWGVAGTHGPVLASTGVSDGNLMITRL
jgi:hypothetical protein